MKKTEIKRQKVCFFGHFGLWINFGNESTLQTMLYHLHRHLPDAEITCICSGPEAVAAMYNIAAFPISGAIVKPWAVSNPLARLVRKVLIGIPSELYRWFKACSMLKGTDMLVVPGTGLLTDAYGLFNWGPYNLFKYSVVAKLRGCKLFLVSVGAGPIYSSFSRCLIKLTLSMADFRSYRDKSTMEYLKDIGVRTSDDRVYPDLAFSLPEPAIPRAANQEGHRPVVGLGLMVYAGRYSVDKPNNVTYVAYLENLVIFAKWLLDHAYDIRLLIGEITDRSVIQEFRDILKERSLIYEQGRIIDEPISSVADLLVQLAATDVVVATRFHNVLLALVLNKPVISISFHHKCTSLMSEMGLSQYCQDINYLNADRLIEQFSDLEKNAERLKPMIREKTEAFRAVLDEQYNHIFRDM